MRPSEKPVGQTRRQEQDFMRPRLVHQIMVTNSRPTGRDRLRWPLLVRRLGRYRPGTTTQNGIQPSAYSRCFDIGAGSLGSIRDRCSGRRGRYRGRMALRVGPAKPLSAMWVRAQGPRLQLTPHHRNRSKAKRIVAVPGRRRPALGDIFVQEPNMTMSPAAFRPGPPSVAPQTRQEPR